LTGFYFAFSGNELAPEASHFWRFAGVPAAKKPDYPLATMT
jgi:hypothetical protein